MLMTVIGKGGEQITAIQNECQCRVQFAPGLLHVLCHIASVCVFFANFLLLFFSVSML